MTAEMWVAIGSTVMNLVCICLLLMKMGDFERRMFNIVRYVQSLQQAVDLQRDLLKVLSERTRMRKPQ